MPTPATGNTTFIPVPIAARLAGVTEEPLRTVTFTLTATDALAFEALPRPFTGWGRAAFVLWLMLAGVAVTLLPESLTGGRGAWGFWALGGILVAIQYVLAMICLTLVNFARASRRVPNPVEVRLVEWGDRFAVTQAGAERIVPFRDISKIHRAPRHLLLETASDVLILPHRAFPETGALDALAAFISAFGKDRLEGALPDRTPSEPLDPPPRQIGA